MIYRVTFQNVEDILRHSVVLAKRGRRTGRQYFTDIIGLSSTTVI